MPACRQTGNLYNEFSSWFVFADHARFNHKYFKSSMMIAIHKMTLVKIICFW